MKIIVGALVFLVLGTIGVGIRLYTNGSDANKIKKALYANVGLFAPLVGFGILLLVPEFASAAEGATSDSAGMGFLAAALSTGLATIGAGYAVGSVGSAALGAVSEDPKILGKTLIFVGLAEGIAIYGLIISILIFGRI